MGGIFANNLIATNYTFYRNNATFPGNPGAIQATGPATMRNRIIANSLYGLNCTGGNFDASNLSDDASCGSAIQAMLAQINLAALTVLSNVPVAGFSFQPTDQFGIAARTGGFKQRAVVGGVQIAPR